MGQNSNSSLTENKMKFTLALASLVFIVLASAHEAEDSKNSELAESANNVESADVELLRIGREAGKKDRRKASKRGKKGGKGKKKKSKKNRRNKKKQRNNEKLFCCCNKDTGEKICKKDDSKICLAGFIVCDKPPSPAPTPICPPTPTCPPPPGCEADLAQKMKDLKKVSNWIKQYKRLGVFLKRVSNKKGKSDNFVNASMALGTATMNGTMCGTGGPDPEANDAWNTLKDCKTKVEADCMCSVTPPNNTCEADLQKIFDDM